MSDYIVKDTELTSVANAIRTKGGTNSQLVFPGGFVSAIGNISGGGGSSDFSTAEVTINKGAMGQQVDGIIPWFAEEDNQTYSCIELIDEESLTVKVPLGGGSITVYFSRSALSTNGDIQSLGDYTFMSKILKAYLITGDCTITIS